MVGMFRAFREDESGAVTSDWVVLTAAITGLAFAAVVSVQAGVSSIGPRISAEIENQTVGTPTPEA